MSKQVNHVNIEPEIFMETGLPTGSIMKHNFLLTLLLLVKLTLSFVYNAGQVNNLEREYRDCIKSRRDKVGITRHIIMHQVLYNVHVTLFIG